MKKFFFLLPLMALLFMNACSDSEDDVATNYNVNITVKANEDIVLSELEDLTITAVNLKTSKEQTATLSNGSVAFSLPTGKYDIKAAGVNNGKFINGILSNINITSNQSLQLEIAYATTSSTLIFKEVYFSGVKDYYFKDGFYEIYNNGDETEYLDGIILGIVDDGLPVGTWEPTNSIWVDDKGNLLDRYPMTNFTVYFPGSGKEYPLAPGKSIVVAAYPIDHSSRTLAEGDIASPVNLSKADWEIFCGPYSALDIDVANVPNLEYAFHTWGIEFMPATSGQALILAKLPDGQKVADFTADEKNFMLATGKSQRHLMIPSDYVIDGIEIVPAPANARFKNLLPKTDMGMTWFDGSSNGSLEDGSYSGKSLRRKVASITNGVVKFKDTNNSSEDFITGGGAPTPGVIPTAVDK